MKKFWVVLFLMTFVVGCDSGEKLKIDGNVKIERVITGINPWIEIKCRKATFSYEKRELIVENLTSFHGGGDAGSWITSGMNIINNDLVMLLPSNASFHLYIGKQYHFLPEIVKN